MTTHRNDLLRDAEVTEALAQGLAPAELSAAQRDSMRARIRRRIDATAPPGTVTMRAQEGTWHDIAPGVARKLLREDRTAGRSTYLIRMAPGASAPSHSHRMEQHCLVLEGEVWMGEHVVRSGDWHVALPGSMHSNFSTKNRCLLLISSEIHPGL
jgi:quercetin dioxygenase-like cupin family protein